MEWTDGHAKEGLLEHTLFWIVVAISSHFSNFFLNITYQQMELPVGTRRGNGNNTQVFGSRLFLYFVFNLLAVLFKHCIFSVNAILVHIKQR